MNSALVYPYPIPPPTGAELMSTPIQSGAISRKDKEVYYVVRNINQRLNALHRDLTFKTYKVKVFTVCLIFAMIGILLILIGTATSVLFAEQKEDPVKIAFGALFCIPMLVWMKFMYAPHKEEKQRRVSLRAERGESKHKNLYERIAEQARKYAEPPPRRIKVFANLRKKDHAIIAGTWKEFCEELEHQTGLPPEQQIIKYRDEELKIDLTLKLEEHYGINSGERLYVYNRGGFMIHVHSPIKPQLDQLRDLESQKQEDTEAEIAAKYNSSWMERQFDKARKSYEEKTPKKKEKGKGGASTDGGSGGKKSIGSGSKPGSSGGGGGSRNNSFREDEKKKGRVSWK